MEAAPSAKPRRVSPPIPPNYVSLRQLQELRLKEKEEQEKRQREEAAAAAAAAAARLEAARKAEMKAIAATDKAEKKVSTAASVATGRAKERRESRDGGRGHRWIAVANQPAVLPPARGEGVAGKREGATGLGRGKMGPADAAADARRGGGKPEGKAKGAVEEKAYAVTSAQTRGADAPGKPAEASSRGGKPENKGEGKASGDKSAEPGLIGGSGESAGSSPRRPKWKKGAGGRSAEKNAATAPSNMTGASPPQGVEPENMGKPRPPVSRRAAAGPRSEASDGKKAVAAPAPPTWAAAGSCGGELRAAAETKPEGLAEGSAVAVHVAAEHKPRVARRGAWPRSHGDRRNGTAEQHVRMWVPKAAAAGLLD